MELPTWALAWVAALGLLTVATRWADPTGWLGSDDSAYYCAAEHLVAGATIQRVHHQYARLPMILTAAASMAMFGNSTVAVILPTLLASFLCVALLAVLGRMLWGWWEGLCAATIVSVLPYFRVLSSAAYPEVQSCLWAIVAVMVALLVSREGRRRRALLLSLGCGLSIGLAASVKEFSVYTFVPVAWLMGVAGVGSRRHRILALATCAGGVVAYFFVECLVYSAVAGDFWFRVRALRQSHSVDWAFPAGGYYEAGTVAELVWNRLTMLWHWSTSGWGLIAVVFWPAALVVLAVDKAGRVMSIWAMAAYLLVAFLPLSFRNGPQPFPAFDGRHALQACLPFALCTAWMIRRFAGRALPSTWVNRAWPAAVAIIAAGAYANPRELQGFRDRETRRVAEAISLSIDRIPAPPLGDIPDVFMSPNLYWRFKILFPSEYRPHLHVSADEESPSWWRSTTVDIAAHQRALPSPGHTYLLTTPRQLRGELERWDYGVRLPKHALQAWRERAPLATVWAAANGTLRILPARDANQVQRSATAAGRVPVLYLLGPPNAHGDPHRASAAD